MTMKYGFVIPGGDAHEIVELGVEIEKAGWDAAFGWETVYGLDPWVMLGGIAVQTDRIKLGTLLTPPSRRRPWKLASELATLDQLSNGRAVLSVGLGALDTGFAAVGEETDRGKRAELVDESIDLLRLFWGGEPFEYNGKHYRVSWSQPEWTMNPAVRPSVPIWSVALWPHERSMARAFRCDGVLPAKRIEAGEFVDVPVAELAAIKAAAVQSRGADSPFDMVLEGETPPGDEAALEKVRVYAAAGATWWIESMWTNPGGMDAVKARIAAGPPQL